MTKPYPVLDLSGYNRFRDASLWNTATNTLLSWPVGTAFIFSQGHDYLINRLNLELRKQSLPIRCEIVNLTPDDDNYMQGVYRTRCVGLQDMM